MAVRPGEILSVKEVRRLPEWETIKKDGKSVGADLGGSKRLYQAIRDQATAATGPISAPCQAERKRKDRRNEGTYRTKWKNTIKKLINSVESGELDAIYKWHDAVGRACMPAMDFVEDDVGGGLFVCFRWQWKEDAVEPPHREPPPDDATNTLRAAVVFCVPGRAGGEHFHNIETQFENPWESVDGLGSDLLVMKLRRDEGSRDAVDRAAEFALSTVQDATDDLSAALVIERPTASPTDFVNRAIQIARKQRRRGALFFDRRTYCELQSEFFCEPVEDFRGGPLYRVWSGSRPRLASDELIAEADELCSAAIRPGVCLAIPVSSAAESAFWWYALRRWALRQWPGGTVLSCQCSPEREFDLLNPVMESLRDMINVNRMIAGNAEDHRLDEAIDAWVNQLKVDPHREAEYKQVLRTLLLGGEMSSAYGYSTEYLAAILQAVAQKRTLTLLVTDIHVADLATRQLLAEICQSPQITLLVAYDPQQERAEDFWTSHCIGNNLEDISMRLRDAELRELDTLSDEELQLLKIAVILGPDALRSWLRNLWCEFQQPSELDDDRDHPLKQAFEMPCNHLLQLGILRVSGRLADIKIRHKTYRELHFATRWHLEEVARQTNPSGSFSAQVRHVFASVLHRKHLRVPGGTVDSVRRKSLVCHYLKQFSPSEMPSLTGDLARLWLIAAERAFASGFAGEATTRIRQARRLLYRGDSPANGEPVEVVQCDAVADKVALRLLAAEVVTFCLASGTGEFATDEKLVAQARSLMDSLDACWQADIHQAEIVFALYRSLWSHLNAYGASLDEAHQVAVALHDRFNNSCIKSSVSLRVETEHVMAVSSFGQGLFGSVIQAGTAGKDICLKQATDTRKFDNTFKYGSHCGGGCCKVLLALGTAISKADCEAAEAIAEDAQAYVDRISDPTSRLIVCGYHGLLKLLNGDYAAAQHTLWAAFRIGQRRGSGRWWRLVDLLYLSAAIGLCMEDCASLVRSQLPSLTDSGFDLLLSQPGDYAEDVVDLARNLEAAITLEIDAWRATGEEYLPIWLNFKGLAAHLQGNNEQALEVLAKAIEVARERQEYIYLPEIYRWRARVFSRLAQPDRARADLDDASQVASRLEARLYLRHIATEREKLDS